MVMQSSVSPELLGSPSAQLAYPGYRFDPVVSQTHLPVHQNPRSKTHLWNKSYERQFKRKRVALTISKNILFNRFTRNRLYKFFIGLESNLIILTWCTPDSLNGQLFFVTFNHILLSAIVRPWSWWQVGYWHVDPDNPTSEKLKYRSATWWNNGI
jgi:hypothetical protein